MTGFEPLTSGIIGKLLLCQLSNNHCTMLCLVYYWQKCYVTLPQNLTFPQAPSVIRLEHLPTISKCCALVYKNGTKYFWYKRIIYFLTLKANYSNKSYFETATDLFKCMIIYRDRRLGYWNNQHLFYNFFTTCTYLPLSFNQWIGYLVLTVSSLGKELAIVLTQSVEQYLPPQEISGSNPVISNLLFFLNCIEKTKEKKARNSPFKKYDPGADVTNIFGVA